MLTDAHCHLASHKFEEEEIPSILERAKAAGVNRVITLATSLNDIAENLEIARFPGVHACIGIHPCDVHHAPDDAVDQLAAFAGDERVCALGETGLDYYHAAPEGWDEAHFRERQRTFLRSHFELAKKCGLHVVIHTRDQTGTQSFEDALQIYKDYHREVSALFHCYIGGLENAQRVFALGGVVSFGGVTTFKNATDVAETARLCPAGSFFIETDAPYLAPVPFRGKRNEPAYARHTAEHLATVRGETLEELAAHTETSIATFFRLER